MYKIIYNGNVIDVLQKIQYLRYLKKSGKIVLSDASSANCIQASNNKDVYIIQGAKLPGYLPYPQVIIKKISETEYNKLKKLLDSEVSVTGDSFILHEARETKIKELSEYCANIITKGISVKLTDGKFHKFELTLEDQLNLSTIQYRLAQGAVSAIYHEKDKVCRLYSKKDLETIITFANKHVEYNTTYFNLLKNCIYNMYDIDVINNVHYGDPLPNLEYQRFLEQL